MVAIAVTPSSREAYAAVFLGTGAGLPHMMGIPGENLIGTLRSKRWILHATGGRGQFVVLCPTDESERIPLILVDGDLERATIRLIFQAIGKTTHRLASMRPGDALADLLGPLGDSHHQ